MSHGKALKPKRRHEGRLSSLLAALIVACIASSPITVASSAGKVQTAQAFGSRCTTALGVCVVTPRPLGSVCYCGNTQGTTTQ